MKVVLAINAGSSSVKISVYTVVGVHASPTQIADAQVTGLTAPPAKLTYKRGSAVVSEDQEVGDVKGQGGAFKLLLDTLIDDAELPEIASADDIPVACHRIVHGGDYGSAQIVTTDTYHHLEALADLAPLHNGPALAIVDACLKQLPKTAVNVACFDSQFHTTIPPHISTYPIDQDVARKNHLRKYGFHGISYAFITRSVARLLGKDKGQLNIIALHLGSGASACAIRDGKSWDTSMGLTPLAGLPGATRSGSIDPSLVFHYASDVGKLSPASTQHLHISKAEEILNKQSGWSALTGTTDFGAIAASEEPSHRLAFDIFVDRISAFVGSYYVSLGGRVDALVFAGGIGERSAKLRAAVTRQVGCLGFNLDEDKNDKLALKGSIDDITAPTAADNSEPIALPRHKVLVCKTDEQLEMALTCADMEELW